MASAASPGNAVPDNALSGNALPGNVTSVVVRRPRRVAYWCPLMAIGDVWLFRIVHQDTGKPAQGVPVTVLDRAGNAAGHWVSDADGIVAVPRRDISKLRLRVGLRSEDPIELATATLGDEPTPLAAPSQLPPPMGSVSSGERALRELHAVPAAPPATAPPARGPDPVDVPGHVLYFQRLAMFAERGPSAAAPARDPVADFFALAGEGSSAMRYGALIEVEEFWQSLGVQWGELLYSATLTPGDEAKLVVLDGRWRREADGRERPLQILARMVGTSMLGDLVSALRPELQLDALTLTEPGLEAAATDTVQMVRDRTERMSNALRRRPLGVVDAPADAPASGAVRPVRTTTRPAGARPRPPQNHRPAAPPPRRRAPPRRCPRQRRRAHGPQHHPRSSGHVPLLRAARALQGHGAEPAGSTGDLRAVPTPQRGDHGRGAALRVPVPPHAARSRHAARPRAAARRR